ncbi:MAG: hypothetical protein IKE61_02305 [Coriobacteriales bacterium]|nr:hypothetical protein [Coriobacteriales bacterium]
MDYSAANSVLWNPIIQLGMIAIVVLIANFFCRKIPAVRKAMIPTAVIAGFLMLLLKYCHIMPVDGEFMEIMTYHGIAIGFIALTLRVPDPNAGDKGRFTGLKSGAIIVSSYMIQAAIGLIITISLALTLMPDLFEAAGILLPMGFGQGPGQANNIGTTFEMLGFAGGRSFGLSIAAAGYICACVVGVIYVNYLVRRGSIKPTDHEMISGSLSVSDFQQEGELPISESLDKLSMQVMLVLIVYIITFFATWGLTSGISAVAPGVGKTVNSLLWGFNFIIGSAFAILVRVTLKKLRGAHIMEKQYQNNYLLSRISGFCFDVMIVAAIASIEFEDLAGLWLPFILLVVAGAVITLFHLKHVCRKAYPDYYYEGLVSMYGMMTGTISSGVLLLREIDPQMKTPAANNLVVGSSFGILLGAPFLVLVGLAPKSMTLALIVLGICIVYYFVLVGIVHIKGKKKVGEG